MKLSTKYQWLQKELGPRHLLKAVELYGTEEVVGPIHNPVIMGWAKETALEKVYTSDEIPWCGLYAAIVMKRSDIPGSPRPIPNNPLRALSWNNFGVQVNSDNAMLGDVLTFTRNGGGHVGFYVGEDDTAFHVLGGNQGNKVSIVRINKSRLSQVRRPLYHTKPLNIRKIYLDSNGTQLSTNEA